MHAERVVRVSVLDSRGYPHQRSPEPDKHFKLSQHVERVVVIVGAGRRRRMRERARPCRLQTLHILIE